MVWGKVCPAIGFALVFGNLWYAWMACKLAKAENRTDVTALPYGVNTPAGFLTVFMVQLSVMFTYNPRLMEMSPEDFATKSWKTACAANLLGGFFEVSGIVLGEFMRQYIPRAALFAPICGVGFVWLGYNPLIDVMREPLVGFLPLFLTFSGFFAKGGAGLYNNKIPIAFVMMLVGTIFWWAGLARHNTEKRILNDPDVMGEYVDEAYETYAGSDNMEAFTTVEFDEKFEAKFVAIVFPIALASFIETIENVEMAHLTGDSYNVKEAMLADGLGTVFGALFGSVIPTTVYIGHVRHKKAGAKWLYSFLNALAFFILLMSGLMPVLFYIIDGVSVGCILIAVGLMIVQSTMEATASRHYPCLMIGIMFLVSDMLYFDHFDATVRVATRSIGRMKGVMNMAPGGGIMCSLMVTAILCDIVDSRYGRATVFCFVSGFFSFMGVMHGANYIYPDGRCITVIGTSDADFYTTDLGELTWSLPVEATNLAFQYDKETGELCEVGKYMYADSDNFGENANKYDYDDNCMFTQTRLIPPYEWEYKVDDLGFDDPFRCTPWNRNWGGMGEPQCMVCGDFAWGFAGLDPAYSTIAVEGTYGNNTYGKQPAYTPPTQTHPYNEGWRFGIAYFCLSVVCFLHYLGCKALGVEGVYDNGYAGDLIEAPKKEVSAA